MLLYDTPQPHCQVRNRIARRLNDGKNFHSQPVNKLLTGCGDALCQAQNAPHPHHLVIIMRGNTIYCVATLFSVLRSPTLHDSFLTAASICSAKLSLRSLICTGSLICILGADASLGISIGFGWICDSFSRSHGLCWVACRSPPAVRSCLLLLSSGDQSSLNL